MRDNAGADPDNGVGRGRHADVNAGVAGLNCHAADRRLHRLEVGAGALDAASCADAVDEAVHVAARLRPNLGTRCLRVGLRVVPIVELVRPKVLVRLLGQQLLVVITHTCGTVVIFFYPATGSWFE